MMNRKLHLGGSIFHGTPYNYSNHIPPSDILLPMPPGDVPDTPGFPSPLYLPTKAPAKEAADSGLTCYYYNNSNRKRPREYYDCSMPDESSDVPQRQRLLSSLLEREAAVQIQHQQRELDCLVSLHTQRLRTELQERAKQRSKVLAMAVREAMTAAQRERDGEISRLSKLNWALQERMRSLCVENELWRGLAQSNEAAANSLRTDLERVLTSPGIVDDRKPEEDEDAESCCGSSVGATDEGDEPDDAARRGCKGGCGGRKEAGVMVMPCRHLCLCTTCGSGSRQSCPVCGSAIAASIHVNFSSPS